MVSANPLAEESGMSEQDFASAGEISQDEIGHHGEGFEKAFEKALKDLDGSKYAGKELEVRAFISITPNPGGVSQYKVELKPKG
jgi:hypothetical protein